jgi:hypothetical protein
MLLKIADDVALDPELIQRVYFENGKIRLGIASESWTIYEQTQDSFDDLIRKINSALQENKAEQFTPS